MEIKFRGKRKDNSEWIEGFYANYGFTGEQKPHIIPTYASALYAFEVIPETVGQYTGLHDKNGREIYDGDILRLWKSVGSNGELRREYYKPLAVEYNPNWCQFVVEDKEFKTQRGIWLEFGAFEIIGNIHDNFTILCS